MKPLQKLLNPQTVLKCMLDAAKGKLHRKEIIKAFQNFDETYDTVVRCVTDPRYQPREDNKHQIFDGRHHKLRTIEKPMFCPEQILHHLLMEPFKEVVLNGLYEQVYGCLPESRRVDRTGKLHIRKYGPHAAAKRLKKWAQTNSKIYVAELDVHHAYGSVDIPILLSKLRETIDDPLWLGLTKRFLTGKGLTLGHYTSPWFFNFYLKDFDHYAATLGVKYLRFADNLFMVSPNKRKLRKAVNNSSSYLRNNLRLILNRSAQIYRFEYVDREGKVRGRAVNALGFVIHHNRVTLRKSLLKAIRGKANRISKKKRITWHDGASMLSRLSWIHASDTYTYYQNHIKEKLDVNELKRKVTNHSRIMQAIYAERRRIIHDGLERSHRLSGREAQRI